ncbi:ATPases involved in chromosome partitioning-like (plasmid) [Rhodoferax ferrireducens T118]|uniref:ATPases involved in chromosome partitioning-like n=1 Tax=Albidiferax ferrireducens (strain ATCC BAA-621 / DSM 15236 / T118) TaxID=338969 RepID=Q21QH3_ALBFT|nr:chromosome partitioning ATPase-like [Rhodoferax ferrireducens]ABD71972.1 ATPases involved in chromosome partitioning-like [Rhodoferax ferrireducens T118]
MTIVVIGHPKGGVGKSTVATSYARRAMDEALSVVLVDTDSTSSSANFGAIRAHLGTTPHVQVVQIIDAPTRSIIDLNEKYDVVVVDIGARDYSKVTELARIADLWVAPTQLGQNDMAATVLLYEAFQHANHSHIRGRIPIGILFNKVPGPWNSTEEQDAREFLNQECPGIHLFNASLKERKAWRDAGRIGSGISEMTQSTAAKARDEFEAFFQESMALMQSAAKKAIKK